MSFMKIKNKHVSEFFSRPYLESNPQGFSKIVHDYSNDDKGFVVWKGQLEERLI